MASRQSYLPGDTVQQVDPAAEPRHPASSDAVVFHFGSEHPTPRQEPDSPVSPVYF